MYQQRIRSLLTVLWSQIGLLTLLLLGARYAMFQVFVDPQKIIGYESDVQRMWWIGLRFDLRATTILLSPLLLAGLLLSIKNRGWRWLNRLAPAYCGIIAALTLVIAVSNYYYYQTYHDTFNIFIFGLMNDDTSAVLKNIWQDYPVIVMLLSAVSFGTLAIVIYRFLIKRLLRPHWPVTTFIAYMLMSITMLFVIARGSLGSFPLRRDHTQISTVTVLNRLTSNGLMAIDWAIGDYKQDTSFAKVSVKEGNNLLRLAKLDSLYVRTPVNPYLEAKKPHVVLALMESMSSNMLILDRMPDNDLLGALRPQFASDFVFRRFISGGNTTAASFSALFFHSPVQNISHSSAQQVQLKDTPYLTYKNAGYKVIFITSGNGMWRNIGHYLSVQGVDEIYDQSSLMRMYPESADQLTDWGIPDKYAFRLAKTLLSNSKQPLFISILTITNHPPYTMPTDYKPQTFSRLDALAERITVKKDYQLNMFHTYQYATNTLGKFISSVKCSPQAENTIIAASGDHRMHRFKTTYPLERFLDHAVPFYLYIPKSILQHSAWHFDPRRVGSHKDIMPTLYAYSLSNTQYQALGGRNMLAPQDDSSRAFGYNIDLWIDAKGAYPLSDQLVLYPWAKDHEMHLEEKALTINQEQQQRIQAYIALLQWQINARVKGLEKDKGTEHVMVK